MLGNHLIGFLGDLLATCSTPKKIPDFLFGDTPIDHGVKVAHDLSGAVEVRRSCVVWTVVDSRIGVGITFEGTTLDQHQTGATFHDFDRLMHLDYMGTGSKVYDEIAGILLKHLS